MPSDSVFDFNCPQCQYRLKARLGAAGRRAKCPKCQLVFVIPAPPASARPAATSPAVPLPAPVARADTPTSSAPPSKHASQPPQHHSPADFTAADSAAPPRSGPKPLATMDDKDWLTLGEPAIGDLSERQQLYESTRQAKERERLAHMHKQQARRSVHGEPNVEPSAPSRNPVSTGKPFSDGPADTSPATHSPPALQPVAHDPSSQNPSSENSGTHNEVKRSIFDDDLPELSELQQPGRPSRSIEDLLAAHIGESEASAGMPADLVPKLPPIPKGKSRQRPTPSSAGSDPEYRVVCAACGTPQYARISQVGKKIQCPDCHLKFPIPAPPPGWKPSAQTQQRDLQSDWHTSSGDGLQAADTQDAQRSRASRMLELADQQALDEELDRLYEDDFDTANFVQRTFGFLKDPVVLVYIFANAIVFAAIFALAQLAANQAESAQGKGLLLIAVIGAPVVGLLFALPMLSGGIALIESVANGQRRVSDWPSFNLFENAGDMLAISAALLGSVIPGYLLGSWLGGDDPGAGRLQIAGMMASSLFLFPIFLLSMLDNGSLFAPFSNSVLKSLGQAAEAWGGYFLKTAIGFAVILLLWMLLLGKDKPVPLAAIAGSLLPVLIFFTCQQIGALAGSISEHLSFDFTPSGKDADDDEDRG